MCAIKDLFFMQQVGFRLINGGRTSLVFQISEGFSGGKYGFSSVVIAYAITRIPEVGNWLLFRRNKKYV